MAKYIPLDAALAEIKRIMNEQQEICKADVAHGKKYPDSKNVEVIYHLQQLIKSLNALEVKDVDLEKYYHEFLQKEWFGKNCSRTMSEMMAFTAKHFFELGLRVSQPTTSVYGIEEALKKNGIDPDSKEADMYREAIYKIYDRLKAQKGE